MGFGHLHTASSKDIAAEFGRIVAAIEDRTPIGAGEVARTISRQRFLIVGLGALLILNAASKALTFQKSLSK